MTLGSTTSGARLAHAAPRSRALAAVALAVALAAISWSPPAAAQCTGLTAATDVVFTGYTPFGPGVAATATLSYACTGTTSAWISISEPRTLSGGGSTLAYELYEGADRAVVWPDGTPAPVPAGATNTVTVYGFLPPQNAAAGTYHDFVWVRLYSGQTQVETDKLHLPVSANVAATCTIDAATLSFGSYDPLGVNAVTPLDAQGTIQIACTRSTLYTVGLGAGSSPAGTTRQMANAAYRLQYGLYTDALRTTPWSTTTTVSGTAPSTAPIPLTVYGRIPGGQNIAAGPYIDVVQSTINF